MVDKQKSGALVTIDASCFSKETDLPWLSKGSGERRKDRDEKN